ncbi:uncharacterized protein Z518_04799 [Rhinocladiella mackenziei CBS 650.93]|uniref:Uncharacterized protein n=1 Tax=Rhinocladiella mackenziei CBS 650.93 TaxID=1442369 RepID=A0A0D2H8N1_9EURO|nr:uncharacterized protein Z518_04799 [Rhinocladiella mackenziei CBS 650.93]KIX06823.1 hypothetical protein Z518_04799 [Rhinocladiella mackenziei CBS 650.93]
MSANQSIAVKHWARIIKRWPVDQLRPEYVSFQKCMQNRLQDPSSTPVTPEAKPNKTVGTTAGEFTSSPEKDIRQVNALYALLEDRFAKEYPTPNALRHPKATPTHYDDLAKEMEAASTRSWAGQLWNRLKGVIRWG